MRRVWCIADSIISPLGNTSAENYAHVMAGQSGVNLYHSGAKEYWISKLSVRSEGLLFDQICRDACIQAMSGLALPPDRTLLILSTTKGNVELLETAPEDPRLELHTTARNLAELTGLLNYQVVSNACISGVLALIIASRLIRAGKYDHAVVVGADVVTDFVLSGFESLMALSPGRCRPFDSTRNGINLGEAAAVMVLSASPAAVGGPERIEITGAGVSNDANHISGPSRTGAELAMAIDHALRSARLSPADIDMVSAHGTATVFNDEMEAKAFHLVGLQSAPVNSLKGYFGHTLGAAGVLESVISIHALLHNETPATLGFLSNGTTQPLNVSNTSDSRPLKKILKTASGFGGCNAAVVFEKKTI